MGRMNRYMHACDRGMRKGRKNNKEYHEQYKWYQGEKASAGIMVAHPARRSKSATLINRPPALIRF